MASDAFRHEVTLYEGPDSFLEATAPFLREALEATEPALVAVSRRNKEALQEELGRDAGQIGFVDIERLSRNPALTIPLWRGFLDEQYQGMMGIFQDSGDFAFDIQNWTDTNIYLSQIRNTGGNFDGTGAIEVCVFYLRGESD